MKRALLPSSHEVSSEFGTCWCLRCKESLTNRFISTSDRNSELVNVLDPFPADLLSVQQWPFIHTLLKHFKTNSPPTVDRCI
ncbi:uncharacterized protein V6R79_016584 [Siganus canaliculatus]